MSSISQGKKTHYDAELRKPLVFVGAALPAERRPRATRRQPVQVIDPAAAMDLARSRPAPINLAGDDRGGGHLGRAFVVAANGNALSAFDTGTGKTVPGALTLAFAPTRLVGGAARPGDRGARSRATARDGSLAIISDVAGFGRRPGGAAPKTVRMAGAIARTAAFSPDGSKLYVLTGGTAVDPCAPGATAAANAIQIYGLDGSMTGMFTLSGFAADVDRRSAVGARSCVADVAGKQVATLDPTTRQGALDQAAAAT